MYRVGVDVGGTNTDAVLMANTGRTSDNRGIVSYHKTATTAHVTDGIETALKFVLEESKIDRKSITSVIIGTTHFINAVIERDTSRLDAVAVLRLASDYTKNVPPFSDFPASLARVVNGYHAFCCGGCNIDGSEISPINVEEIKREAIKIKSLGIRSIVVAGIYSPVDEVFKQEEYARSVILSVYAEAQVVCSRDVANVGLLERENASILNASILRYARLTIRDFKVVMRRLRISCDLYLTQNDGTLVGAASASLTPIRTFSSGAANSMRGASYLASDITTAGRSTIIVDIGGTTTDVGMILPSGFPRQTPAYSKIAGVRVNYAMPYLHSIGLGGGSRIRTSDNGKVTVGPDSVGHQLTTESLAFGGATLTTTDIMVRAGNSEIGDPALVTTITEDLVSEVELEIRQLLTTAIDLMKMSPQSILVVLVGGGSGVAPDMIAGASMIVRPKFYQVANAVGAAIAKVSGIVDTIECVGDRSMQALIASCTESAMQKCIEAGAIPSSVSVAELVSIPIQYTTDRLRVIVKCVGELQPAESPTGLLADMDIEDFDTVPAILSTTNRNFTIAEEFDESLDISTYRPMINAEREWILSETDVKLFSIGCYVLGCAGGGSPYADSLQLRDLLRQGHVTKIVSMDTVKDSAIVLFGGFMGSPAVSVERLGDIETIEAVRELLKYTGIQEYDAVMGLEVGGSNGLQPLLMGSSKHFDRPCLDADFMGRAFPTYYQTTMSVYRPGELVPAAIASGHGNCMIMTKSNTDKLVDVALRAACTEMGNRVGMAAKPTTGEVVKQCAVSNTMSLAWRIGRAVYACQHNANVNAVAERIIEEVGGSGSAKKLFCGRIINVASKLHKGHSYGTITLEPLLLVEDATIPPPEYSTGLLHIPYKNENILAEHEPSPSPSGARTIVASVPDLICVLDAGNGESLGVPEYRYGLRVIVLGITASPRWTDTEAGLALGGPAAFGYDFAYRPLGTYVEPRSVIDEYAPTRNNTN